jgi:hypothetical protein
MVTDNKPMAARLLGIRWLLYSFLTALTQLNSFVGMIEADAL